VELCRNNSPCPVTGVTPRDLDRAWSIATPLERELLPADRGELVSISDHAVGQFTSWKAARALVLQHRGREGRRRADLANRYRRESKQLREGDSVLVAGPLLKREARHPWRSPLGGHVRVVRVKGAKVDIHTESGLLEDVHHDLVIVIPDDAEDFEARPDLKLADDAEGARRSPGQMLEGWGLPTPPRRREAA
jgi:hypothetical protein